MQYQIINVDWRDEKSIIAAEKKKEKLENEGYTLENTKLGINIDQLIYRKET
jgi:hypothetical protein